MTAPKSRPGEQEQEQQHSQDEAQLFRRAMQDVRPLKPSARVPAERRRPAARARFARAERASVLRESLESAAGLASAGVGTDLYELQPGDELLFRRKGVPENVVRGLRRGLYRIDAEIDLHGYTVAEAHGRLGSFLREARSQRLHCVRVIHGKGLRSGSRGPVLKNSVNAYLRRMDAVLAFVSARPLAGGTGATLVLLSRA
jgi:DNA-nicking Smr family endonuclease